MHANLLARMSESASCTGQARPNTSIKYNLSPVQVPRTTGPNIILHLYSRVLLTIVGIGLEFHTFRLFGYTDADADFDDHSDEAEVTRVSPPL